MKQTSVEHAGRSQVGVEATESEMERDSFLNLLAERFYPALRAEGFRGSGTTLRRMQDPVVHVVNVQGSSSADGFYVNLGAHLSFLPTDGGGAAFRQR